MLFTTETLTRLWQHILLVVDKRVEKVEGKGLSTNDYTNEDKQKLSNIPGDIQSQLNAKASTSDLSKKVDVVEGKGLSTNDYTTAEKQKLANIPANTQSQLDTKADISELEGKVDVVEGKGLSTNDYSNEDKQKLASIPSDLQSQLNSKVNLSNFVTASIQISSELSTIDIPASISSTDRMLVFHNGLLLAKDIHYSVGASSISLSGYVAQIGDVFIFMTI